MDGNATALVLRATLFASQKHVNQRRKNASAAPYVNHVIEVAHFLASVGKVEDREVLAAGLLHDTLEDTATTRAELEHLFGGRVAGIVAECTDDKSLPKVERKRLQIEHARTASKEACLVKMADKLSNLNDLASSPPAGWAPEVVRGYAIWSMAVLQAMAYKDALLALAIANKVLEIAGTTHVTEEDLEAYYAAIEE